MCMHHDIGFAEDSPLYIMRFPVYTHHIRTLSKPFYPPGRQYHS